MKSVHYNIIDILRGGNIILVVIGHVISGVVVNANIIDAENKLYLLNEILHTFRMPLFFIVSGILVDKFLIKRLKDAIKRKCYRLVLPYFIWSFITAICMEMISKYTTHGLGLLDWIKSPIIPFFQFWFLYDLFFIFLIIYMFYICFTKKCKIMFLYFSIICHILYILSLVPDYWILVSLAKYMIFFSIGSFILSDFEFLLENKMKKKYYLLAIFLFIFVSYIYILILTSDIKDKIIIFNIYNFILAIVGSYFIFVICKLISMKKGYVDKILEAFGRNSMIVYCIHLFFISGLIKLVFKIYGTKYLECQVFVYSMIVLLLCYICFTKLIPKNNPLRILFGDDVVRKGH